MRRNFLALGLFALGGCNEDLPGKDAAALADVATVNEAGSDGGLSDGLSAPDGAPTKGDALAASDDAASAPDQAASFDASPADLLAAVDGAALAPDQAGFIDVPPPDLGVAVDALVAMADRAAALPDHSTAPFDLALPDLRAAGDMALLPPKRYSLAGAAIYSSFFPLDPALAVGDVNGDGRADVILSSSGTIVLMTAGTDGSLAPPAFGANVGIGVGVGYVFTSALADLDGDGKIDLVSGYEVESPPTFFVSILRGNGTGGFAPVASYANSAGRPSSIGIADVNGDKKLDLVVGTTMSTLLTIFAGNGDGTLKSGAQIDAGIIATGLALDDWNGDGKTDVAVVDDNQLQGAGRLAVLFGNGSGSFQPAATYAAGISPHAVVSGDFNGDGKADLAVAAAGSSRGGATVIGGAVFVLLNNGSGGFRPAAEYAAGPSPRDLVALDVDGDGKRDLAVASATADIIPTLRTSLGVTSILRGVGDGTFKAAVTYYAGDGAQVLRAGDLNGDGKPDLVNLETDLPVAPATTHIGVLLNGAGGNFVAALTSVGGAGASVALGGDVNGDGRADLVEISPTGSTAYYLAGLGNGRFAAPLAAPVGRSPGAGVLADLNGDGKLDLATANSADNTVSLLFGDGMGRFPTQTSLVTGKTPSGIVAGDWNNDGRTDLAVANQGGGTVAIYLSMGRGNFQPTPVNAGNQPTSLAAADFNLDHYTDLAVLGGTPGNGTELRVLLGDGKGGFSSSTVRAVAAEDPTQITACDLDGDGNPDVVTIFHILLGDGKGAFTAAASAPLWDWGVAPRHIAVGDVNLDGKLDVLSTPNIAYSVGVLLSPYDVIWPGIRNLGMPFDWAVGMIPSNPVVADFNGDGKPDIAVADGVGSDVAVLLNTTR